MCARGGILAERIFISYRREDSAYPAGWLYERLAQHFGAASIFKDVDAIRPGDNFVSKITSAIGACSALLALIGDRWLTIADESGRRRLDNPSDFVRLEIGAALARSIRVIPVLVNGAQMPRSSQLPDSLKELSGRQAIELKPSQFNSDANRLIRSLESTFDQANDQSVINQDNGGFRHYVRNEESDRAISARNPIRALCGWRWIPERSQRVGDDLSDYSTCPRCQDIYDSLPSGSQP